MLKRSLIIFLFLLICVSFVSAGGVIIKPSEVKLGGNITFIIDFENYGSYVFFYEANSTDYMHILNLNCEGTCYGKKTFVYQISDDIFDIGTYRLVVYSYDNNEYFDYKFKVVAVKCSDGTLVGRCSITKPKYCDGSETLIDDCQTCGCPISYNCQDDGMCVGEIICTDSDGGLNYYIQGTASVGPVSATDICISQILKESACTIDEEGFHQIYVKDYNCPFGCKNGACVREGEGITCLDGTLIGQCSTTKPKYCDGSETLIDDCQACGCPFGYECQTSGSCAISDVLFGPNIKQTSLYSNKEVFLVSDGNWKNVLPFVSVAVWTQGNAINKYPFLIFHEEDSNFDIDSIIYFMQQYNPDKVTIIGVTPQSLDNLLIASPDLGVGLQVEDIQRISVDDYLSYWQSFNKVIYVDDDYELALLASTYASLINAPLIIQGTVHDSANIFSGRNVVCIGSVTPAGSSCSETYNLGQLQQKYVERTNTDKVILVNPDDYKGKSIEIDGTTYIIHKKVSLIAPILASAKHELIISITKTNSEEIDNYLEQKISELFNDNVKYLTIMASSEFIPHSEKMEGFSLYDWRISLDASSYADLTGDNKPDISVGRISGFTVTDVSSYIARSLVYNTFSKTNNMKFMASSFFGILKNMADTISTYFSDAGFNAIPVTTAKEAYDFNPNEWINQDLIYYTDHGAHNWAGITSSEIPQLSNSLVVIAACNTVKKLGSGSFGVSALKNGAIGYMGSVGVTFLSTEYTKYLNEVFYHEKTLGDAFKGVYSPIKFHAGDMFLGDPTLDINPKHLLKKRIPVLLMTKQCKIIGDWCCEGRICASLKQTCCSSLDCEGFLFFKECKDNRCEGTDTSCGYKEATGSCTNCKTMSPDLICNFWKAKVKGYYFKCNDDQLCTTKIFPTTIEDCQYGCSWEGGAHCRTCENTDTSCGAYENCEDCTVLPPVDLTCNFWKTAVKGRYFKCRGDECVEKFWRQKVEDCSHYCKDGKCECHPKNTKVNLINKYRCCNGWKWVQKSVANYCCWGKWWEFWKCWWNSSKCGTHKVNDYRVCK
jgi:hypothetical protein